MSEDPYPLRRYYNLDGEPIRPPKPPEPPDLGPTTERIELGPGDVLIHVGNQIVIERGSIRLFENDGSMDARYVGEAVVGGLIVREGSPTVREAPASDYARGGVGSQAQWGGVQARALDVHEADALTMRGFALFLWGELRFLGRALHRPGQDARWPWAVMLILTALGSIVLLRKIYVALEGWVW